jgi:hypothetical protein
MTRYAERVLVTVAVVNDRGGELEESTNGG